MKEVFDKSKKYDATALSTLKSNFMQRLNLIHDSEARTLDSMKKEIEERRKVPPEKSYK